MPVGSLGARLGPLRGSGFFCSPEGSGGRKRTQRSSGGRSEGPTEGPKAGILSVRLDQSELGGLEQRGQENRNEEVWS